VTSHRDSARVVLAAVQEQDLHILLPFIRQFYHQFKYPYDELQKSEILRRMIQDASLGRIFFVQRNNTPIGYVIIAFLFSLEFNGYIAFIDELFIEPSFRQEGVGSQVLAQVESLCAGLGMRAVRLESEAHNHRATALYIRSGYRAHHRYIMTKVIKGNET
jgi:diamine N-acetyltransferase